MLGSWKSIRSGIAAGSVLAGAAALAVLPSGAAQAQTEESCSTGIVFPGTGNPYKFDGCGVWSNQGGPFVLHVHEFSQVGPNRLGGGPGNPTGGPNPPAVTKSYDVTFVCSTISVYANGHRESYHCRKA